MIDRSVLREHVAGLIAAASDGALSAAEALLPDASLTELGLNSLGVLRLIDVIDAEYGIDVAPNGMTPPDSIDALVDRMEHGGLRLTD